MPNTTLAAVLYRLGEPLQIQQIEIPELKRGQVLVKLLFAGVCHSQLMETRGLRGEDPWLPHLLGHEGVGEVVAIGADVSKVKPGDVVILGWIKGEGIQAEGAKYRYNDVTINSGSVTTFSDYTIASENRCVLLPAGIPFEEAVLFGCALPTGTGLVRHEVNPTPNSSIVVMGLGGIGMSALIAAKLYKPSQLIAIDVAADKLALAREFGATHIVNPLEADALQEVLKLTGGKGVDYALEAAGLSTTIENAFNMVRRGGGLCVFASHPKQGDMIRIDPFELICGKQIRGSWGGGGKPEQDTADLAEIYLKGELPLKKLLSKPYRLDQINEALDALERREITRALIRLNTH